MGLIKDIKKVILRHAIMNYIEQMDREDEMYHRLIDKRLELCKEENEILRDEIRTLKTERILTNKEEKLEIEFDGEVMKLDSKEIVKLVTEAKKTINKNVIKRVPGTLSLENINSIAFKDEDIRDFVVIYEDGEMVNSYNEDTANLYNVLKTLGIQVESYDFDYDEYVKVKIGYETFKITKGSSWSKEFIQSKLKEKIK